MRFYETTDMKVPGNLTSTEEYVLTIVIMEKLQTSQHEYIPLV